MSNCYAKFVEKLEELGVTEDQFIDNLFIDRDAYGNVHHLLSTIRADSLCLGDLGHLFYWSKTKEGYKFWHSVSEGKMPKETKAIFKSIKIPEDAGDKAVAILEAAGIEVEHGS